jgi:ATP-dependent DNA helicase DinG
MAPPSLYDFFGRGGLLQKAHPAYEHRPGQLEMAKAVAEVLAERRHLLVEAGTGTGKTLAYLLPVLQSGRRVLLSTGTRNLQEQLINKDVPLLAASLGRDLNIISMKGRQNYACKQKIRELESQPILLELDGLEQYQKIRAWAARTEIGDQAELDFLPENAPLWHRLNARRETCTGSKCPLFEECFVTRLHQRAAEAELVVVNHALFFADLVLKRQELPGVLPPYEAVVFDEAHELEGAAAQYFGVSVSSHQIEDWARDARHRLQLLPGPQTEMIERTERLRMAAQKLFLKLARGDGRAPLTDREQFLMDESDSYDGFMLAAGHIQSGLEALHEKPEEIHTLMRRLEEMRRALAFILESDEDGVVYWVERRGRGVYASASPIDVAPRIRELLFESTDSVILTSATLTVEGRFDYVRERLGLDHARELTVASPFQYQRQALLYIPGHLPEPNSPDFTAAATEEIARLLAASRGRAFLLCTSYRQMQAFSQALDGRTPFPLLTQGEAPRHALLEKFRATPGAVLIATSSYWQGVDVQGEQLSLVIVDRLPFAAPNDPVVAARIDALKREGRNAFAEFQIPEAVLSLKQGFGRLIRSTHDRGVLALLDPRIRTKSYGAQFLRSLPEFARAENLSEVESFFATAAASTAG